MQLIGKGDSLNANKNLTQCNEVLSFSWLSRSHWSIVEQQAIGRFCDELQRNVALKARLYGRKPSITIAYETMFGLMTFWSIKHGGTLTPAKERDIVNYYKNE